MAAAKIEGNRDGGIDLAGRPHLVVVIALPVLSRLIGRARRVRMGLPGKEEGRILLDPAFGVKPLAMTYSCMA